MRQKAWYEKNAETVKTSVKTYAQENREKVAAARHAYYLQNKETRSAYRRRHYELNRSNYIADSASRAERCKRSTPPWADRGAIRDLYKKAADLTNSTGIAHHVDHIVPLRGKFVSGLHVQNNLQVIPAKENLRKNNRFEVTP
jgi:5-methylcytosine-specific restriction endonuclease McrA